MNVREIFVSSIIKMQIAIFSAHLFYLDANPAARSLLKAVRKVGCGGSLVLLTAAVVPPSEIV